MGDWLHRHAATRSLTHRIIVLEVSGVSKTFFTRKGFLARERLEVKALQDVSLSIAAGEVLGLVGESGSGKSTLARVIMGLYKPEAGYFVFDEFDSRTLNKHALRALRRNLGIVFQDPASSMNPWMTVADIVAEPIVIQNKEIKFSRSQKQDRVIEILEATGLDATHAQKKIHEFSGGQRQRIAIARALVLKPKFLILDEPISALDVSIQAQILNLLADLKLLYKFAALFITHDLSVVRWFSDRVAVMYLGRIVEAQPAELIFSESKHPYTQALARSKLNLNYREREFYALSGEIPSPINQPPGCPFAPRCERAQDSCVKSFPVRNNFVSPNFYHCFNPVPAIALSGVEA